MLLNIDKEGTVDKHYTMDKCQNNYIEWKKSDKKEDILYDFIYVKVIEMQTNLQWQKTDQ